MNGLPCLPERTPMVLDSLYNYSAPLLNSPDILDFSTLKHKIVLVVNVGVEEGELCREIPQLEKLAEKFSKDGLVILVFPCQQFTEIRLSEEEIENLLEDFKDKEISSGSLVVFSPIHVNGSEAHAIYRYMCRTIPLPADDPLTFTDQHEKITWQPVLRSDVAGNYEKFLILPNGRPYKRYSSRYLSTHLSHDIKTMIKTFGSVRKEGKSGAKYVIT